MSNDFEKQKELLDLAKHHDGVLYCLLGIHPDNVKRSNDKTMVQKVEQLRSWAFQPQVLALACGIDHSREISTHYGQEKNLKDHIALAEELEIPLVITTHVAAFEQVVEHVKAEAGKLKKLAMFNFTGTETDAKALLDLETEVYFVITGAVSDPTDKGVQLRDVIAKLPQDRLLLASDSPFNTPQNIADDWIRERHNEPANLPFALDMFAKCLNMTDADLAAVLRKNTKTFYGLMSKDELAAWKAERAAAVTAAAADNSSTAEKKQSSDEESENSEEDSAEDSEIAKGVESTSLKEKDTKTKDQPATKENIPVVPQSVAKYACHKCRRTLFTTAQVVPHSSNDSFVSSSKRSKTKRQNKGSAEADVCRMLYVKKLDWMKLEGDEDDSNEEETSYTEGKLSCPGCKLKLGRWSAVEADMCSCGQMVPPPLYMILKKNVDLVSDVQADVATLITDEAQEGDDEPEGIVKKSKKKRAKQKKSNTGNFTSFRNKSFGVKVGSAAKKTSASNESEEDESDTSD
eukprot:TRINITY_DN3253_c0_g1_i2.p1 TRINITY_DN3253_c0_g1~~TRINITY_DN3253_c0_g1_i2.p1  ORF type:complete len:518 (+),score=180.58 TRINITY_DN3253_c0_g1_i2:654-2207(+)